MRPSILLAAAVAGAVTDFDWKGLLAAVVAGVVTSVLHFLFQPKPPAPPVPPVDGP